MPYNYSCCKLVSANLHDARQQVATSHAMENGRKLTTIAGMVEHLAAKMREDEPLGPDFRPMLNDVRIVEMKADRLLEKVALGDEEIGTVR